MVSVIPRRGSSSSLYSAGFQRSGSRRTASVYGGERNVRVSYASNARSGFDLSGSLGGAGEYGFGVSVNEKATMQNLNDRLATYLEKVRTLEAANGKLEVQIREWYEKRTVVVHDYSRYDAVIADLRRKLNAATLDNARILLQIDNARLATDDFKLKFENEMAVRMSVEADIGGLRKVLDELTMSRSDLEMQIEGLKEELVYLKKNHGEELAILRAQMSTGSVNVEVDARPQEDLSRVMEEIRLQYTAITEKNRKDMDVWYKARFDELNKQVVTSTETLQTSRTTITELQRSLQALQIDLQSQISLKAALEGQLVETESRYSLQLNQLQLRVNALESELGLVKVDIERQAREYQLLLDIKTRLELEIAEYRRLLDGEEVKTSVITIEKVEVKQPTVTKRVKMVVEKLVDGKVVSHTEDVDEQIIS